MKNKAIFNLPNIITLIRFAFVPVWLVMAELLIQDTSPTISFGRLSVAFFFILLALTDKLDGYLARSRNQVSDFGKFLDPLADKLLVAVPLIYLLQIGLISIWIPTIILFREFLVSGLRMTVASKGVVIAASQLGKWKTATTLVGMSGIFIAFSLGSQMLFIAHPLMMFSYTCLIIATVLTLVSGADYLWKCRAFF